MKIILLILFFLVYSCKDSSIYEIDNAKYKVLKHPVTFIDTKINKLSADKDIIMLELELDELREAPDYYAGLTPNYPMIEGYFLNKFDKSCISVDGGLIYVGRCLVIKINGKFILIDSQEKIKDYFAPIQSKEEAISYLSLSTHSYPIYDFKFVNENFIFKKSILNKTYVDSITDGYEVHLFEKLIFACEHPYYEVVYEIKKDGTFREKNRKEIFRDPKEDGLCID